MKHLLIAITGPSGFGRGKLVDEAIDINSDFVRIVSYTDRPMRENEVEGRDFCFISEDSFTEMIEAGQFVEWQRLISNGYRYGKTKSDFEKILAESEGKVVFSHVNVINLPVFKRFYPNVKSIFIDVRDTVAMIEFLKNSPDSQDEYEYEKRYKFAIEERRRRHLTDFIMNMRDDHDETMKEFLRVVEECKKLNELS